MSDAPQYDIALSFAGEDRELVERCARLLLDAGYRVFYDRWEQHDLRSHSIEELVRLITRKLGPAKERSPGGGSWLPPRSRSGEAYHHFA